MADLESIISGAVEASGESLADDTGIDHVEDVAADDPTVDDQPAGDPNEVVEEEAPVAAEEPVVAAEPEVADLSAAELAGQTIPVSRHKAVLTKARKAGEALQAKLDALKWAEAPETQQKMQALDLADQNPEMFAEVLMADERFAPIFQRLVGGKAPVAPAEVKSAPAAQAAPTEKPQPDVLYPDGSVGYSAGAQEALIEWRVNEAMKQMTGTVEPLLKSAAKTKENELIQAEFGKNVDRHRGIIEKARKTWPGYEKHEAEIKAYVLAPGNERATLEDAYRAVVIPKFQTDEATMRAKLLAEMNKKPAAVLAKPAAQTPTPAPAGGSRTLEEVIAAASAKASAR